MSSRAKSNARKSPKRASSLPGTPSARGAHDIARELDDLLTEILGHCERLLTSLPLASAQRPDAAAIREAAQRSADLARRLSGAEPGRAASKDAQAKPTRRGLPTILLVDDEDVVRRLLRGVLRGEGFHVLEASHASEALALSESHPGSIELLITDLVMPGMGGRELAEQLSARRPEMRVIYVSGFVDEGFVRQGAALAGSVFLQKPFAPGTLTRQVRELLAAPHAR